MNLNTTLRKSYDSQTLIMRTLFALDPDTNMPISTNYIVSTDGIGGLTWMSPFTNLSTAGTGVGYLPSTLYSLSSNLSSVTSNLSSLSSYVNTIDTNIYDYEIASTLQYSPEFSSLKLGYLAASTLQASNAIAIGNQAGRSNQGSATIAIGFKAGFSKADEVLSTASRGIAEVITHHYTQNIDLKDAKTVLSNSGTAIMGSATATGDNRAKDAIIAALDSPLLNDNKINGAKNVLLLIVSGTSEITIDEIGEINDHIQAEAGFNANIIMGVGEDESLGEAIAVTIIATGFTTDQQAEIVNTEPKKIIHSLEDEQRLVRDLIQPSVPVFESPVETPITPVFETSAPVEEKVVFELLEEEVVAPVFTPAVDADALIPMNEFIRNLDVTFEIVSPIKDLDFGFTAPVTPVQEIKVNEPQTISFAEETQATLTFDLPLQVAETPVAETAKLVFDLTDETKNIQVNEPIEFVPMTEVDQGVIRYSLEEYMEIENELLGTTKPIEPVGKMEEKVDETLQFTTKVAAEPVMPKYAADELSPVELTIEETLKMRAEERRRKLKEFNYKFHNNPSRVDELEKEPAYKRMGVDLSANQPTSNTSRLSIGTDSNDDVQLRSNNSFLHDNVD